MINKKLQKILTFKSLFLKLGL